MEITQAIQNYLQNQGISTLFETDEWLFTNAKEIKYNNSPFISVHYMDGIYWGIENEKKIYRYSKNDLMHHFTRSKLEAIAESSFWTFFPPMLIFSTICYLLFSVNDFYSLMILSALLPFISIVVAYLFDVIKTALVFGCSGSPIYNIENTLLRDDLDQDEKSWSILYNIEHRFSQPDTDENTIIECLRSGQWSDEQISLLFGKEPNEIQHWDTVTPSGITMGHIGIIRNDPNIVTEYLKNTRTNNAFDLVKTAFSIAHFDCAHAIINCQPDLLHDIRLYPTFDALSNIQCQGRALKTLQGIIPAIANILTVDATPFYHKDDVADWEKNTTTPSASKITIVDVIGPCPNH